MSDDQLKQHYIDNYDGLTTSELQKRDDCFYAVLQRRGLLKITPKTQGKWQSMSDDELKQMYIDNYNGLTRSAVRKKDRNFFNALKRRDLLEIVPAKEHIDWQSMSDDELKQMYIDNYNGLSRTELYKKDNRFYDALLRRGLIGIIPNKLRDWHSMSDDQLKKHYRDNYSGLSRNELMGADHGFYNALKKKGLIKIIPKKRVSWQSMSDDELKQHYIDNYRGLGRNELREKDQRFYAALQKRGLIEIIPRKQRDWQSMSDDELKQHYTDNYNGLSKSKLVRTDNGFYDILLRRGLIKIIPNKLRNWQSMSDDELKQYYNDNYNGLSRSDLVKKDQSFYKTLRERGLLETIPLKRQLKITTSKAFADFIETEKDAKLILERFGGDDADVADIMAVVYEGRISRDDAMLLMQDPSLRDYLGRFQRPMGIGDLFEAGERLLAYDKNNVIRDIVYRRALEYRSEQLGPKPTREQRERFLDELEGEIAVLS